VPSRFHKQELSRTKHVKYEIIVLCYMTPYSQILRHKSFEGTCCPYLQVNSCVLVKGHQGFGATTFLALQATLKFGNRLLSNVRPSTAKEKSHTRPLCFCIKTGLMTLRGLWIKIFIRCAYISHTGHLSFRGLYRHLHPK